jgi:hypothetical protein
MKDSVVEAKTFLLPQPSAISEKPTPHEFFKTKR